MTPTIENFPSVSSAPVALPRVLAGELTRAQRREQIKLARKDAAANRPPRGHALNSSQISARDIAVYQRARYEAEMLATRRTP